MKSNKNIYSLNTTSQSTIDLIKYIIEKEPHLYSTKLKKIALISFIGFIHLLSDLSYYWNAASKYVYPL